MTAVDLGRARRDIAVACRVMAHQNLVENILGHISLRIDQDHALVRCRGPHEIGLRFSTPDDIRLVDVRSGRIVDDPTGEYESPGELPIHTAVLAARPDVACVVHAHPPDVMHASLADVPLTPMFGAYNIPAARMASEGIPEHPRSVLIRTDALADEMVESLGDAVGVVLRGHGVVSVGSSVAEGVLRALHINTLARVGLAVRQAGGEPIAIPEADLAELPDLGSGFNETTLWRHYLASLDADGFGLKGPS